MMKAFFGILFYPMWLIIRLIPRQKNLWVLGSWFGWRYTDNTKALFEFIVNNNPDIIPIWITRSKEVRKMLRSNGHCCYMRNSVYGTYFCLRASVFIFSSGKQDINPLLMNGAKSVQTWHGSPMKKIGLDNKFAINNYRQELVRKLFPFYYEYNYTYLVSSASYFNDKLSSAFNVPLSNILTVGYPRNDVFYTNQNSMFIEQLNKNFNNPKKIAYLPTFRDGATNYDLFFQFGFVTDDWIEFLEENNAVLIMKSHYAAETSKTDLYSDRIINVSDLQEKDVNLLLKDCDKLITDYSGAYFDFLLTGGEVILAPFDYDFYVNNCRELYVDYSKYDDRVFASWVSILEYLRTSLDKERRVTRTKYNDYYDGYNSERLMNTLLERFGL